MESSSRDIMLETFCKNTIRWRKKKRTKYHLSVVRDYVSKFEPNIRSLSDSEIFNQNLEKFFLVPKPFDTLKKNELIAAFINFIIQLLYHETKLYDNLRAELRFLLMFLGDVPFLYDEEHGVQVEINLLEEVEVVANIAGSSVYSLIFSTFEDSEFHTVEQHFGDLAQCIDLLRSNILKFSNLLPVPVIIDKSSTKSNSKTNPSLFIVDSLIRDLENLLNRDDSLTIGDMKDQIERIHEQFSDFQSLLMSGKMDMSEIQEYVVEVAYEAEYLINSLVAGDAPLWYFSMRLPRVLHKIKLIGTGLQELKSNQKVGNKNFSSQLSVLQANKKNYEVDDGIVVGFEERVTYILDKLERGEKQRQIIFIHGMPGLGKTTFAKKLYNHPTVQHKFDRHSWCVVSHKYQMKSLLADISSSIDQLDKDKISKMDEESLVLKIFQSLKGRKYLAVIDDVWDKNAWNDLERCFPDDRNGSRILVTSKNKDVAPPNSIMVDNNDVDDFEDEKRFTNILKLVEGGTKQLQIIFNFGKPELGKTTFAKKLYNDSMVHSKFDIRSWCVVSQIYQKKSMLIDILTSTLNMEEESLVLKIHQSLKGRRYFAVIDDVWSIRAWEDLQKCFPDDKNGSRILITSRNKVEAPPESIMHELSNLSSKQCWELLEKKVFGVESCPPELLDAGKQVAENCHGLPLAVVVIAGILSNTDLKVSAWKKVEEKVLSYSSCDENHYMMQILELSYTHLPHHLKPCFLYFGVFPEDNEILAKKLMQLWAAEGFTPNEVLAGKYLMELIDRSLVKVTQRRSGGGVKTCVIHDRLRDLCLKIAAEENILKLVDDKGSIYEKSLCLVQSQHPYAQSSFGLYVRSFHGHYELETPFFFANMKLVRVLDFMHAVYRRGRLIGVEYLVNLRYLLISGEWLPSIVSLVNLEYLCVVTNGYKIPSFLIMKMDKLRYLHFTGRTDWAYFDENCNISITSKTNNLQVLSGVAIKDLKDEKMLKCSTHLRTLKCKCEPFYVEEKGERIYRYLDLKFFTHLESLLMLGIFNHSRAVEIINFPLNIKKLNLDNLGLPLENMSIIGRLPNLQVLKLIGAVFVGETWDTNDGEFEKLTFLKLEYTNFKQWNVTSSDHFPKLKRLLLHDCLKLEEIPSEIGFIPTLQLIELKTCFSALEESARKIELEQRYNGNEDLKVIIRK